MKTIISKEENKLCNNHTSSSNFNPSYSSLSNEVLKLKRKNKEELLCNFKYTSSFDTRIKNQEIKEKRVIIKEKVLFFKRFFINNSKSYTYDHNNKDIKYYKIFFTSLNKSDLRNLSIIHITRLINIMKYNMNDIFNVFYSF